MSKHALCVIPGDGVGKEVVPAAVRVLKIPFPKLEVVAAQAGWECFEETGEAVPAESLDKIRQCGAALFGAVSSPSYVVEGYRSAIVTLRRELDLFANLRPVRSLALPGSRPGIDMLILRENTEGLYSGREHWEAEGEVAITERRISRRASTRIGRRACEVAQATGRSRLTIVHKANVMPLSDGLFREAVHAVAAEFPNLVVDELLADIAALWMVRDPSRFEVLVTTNMFGDILSDAAAHWGGGMGLVPALNWGDRIGVAEPVHGSAPDIAGQGVANPVATILSAALLVRYVWKETAVAAKIEAAVAQTLQAGVLTPDLGGKATTEALTTAVCAALKNELAKRPPHG